MITDTIFSHPIVAAVIAALLLLGVIGKLMSFSFERIAKWYLYVAVFSVVIVMNSIFFPFIGGKDFFFRFVVELALSCMVLWWAFEAKSGQLKPRITALFKKPMVIAVSVFVAAVELASLFAYDMHAAFWSNYERGEGGFQMLHYYIFFLLLVLIFNDEKDWKNLFRFSLVSAGLMIVYGLLADFGVVGFIGPYAGNTAPSNWIDQLIVGRFEGTLGNPAYVDPYLIFSMFFAGYLWVSSKLAGKLTTLKSWGYGALIAVFFIFFILGQTRGAFLGLDAGVFILLGYLVFQEGAFFRKVSSAVVLGIAVVAFLVEKTMLGNGIGSSLVSTALATTNLGILVFIGCLAFSKSAMVRKVFRIMAAIIGTIIVLGGLVAFRYKSQIMNLPEARIVQISTEDATAQTRFWVWGEAWQGFLERPLLGWGPENFTPIFDKFFNPNFYVPGQNNETWFDRAHSIYLDYLAETGALGLLSYLAIFFMVYWEFFRKGAQKHAASAVQKGLIIAIPVAYLVQGLAIFDVFPMYLCLFTFFAFAAYYFSVHKKVQA